MKLTLLAIGVAQLAGFGSSAPSKSRSQQRPDTFSLKQVVNEKFHGIDGPTALFDVYAKYGKQLPEAMRKAMEINDELDSMFKYRVSGAQPVTGSVVNFPAPYFDSQYVVPAEIGTPAQTIHLNLDTGSADLWVFSTDTTQQQVQGQTLYRPEDSKTSKLLKGQTWSVKYGDGASANGIVYSDKVTLGGTSFDEQAVQSAVNVSAAISDDSFSSGILGMGKSRTNTVSPDKQNTYIQNILGDLREPLFTVDLQPQQPGTYDFGYIDETKYTGNISYVAADPHSPYWEFSVDGYEFSGKNGTRDNGYRRRPYRFQAIADTGTTLLLLPDNVLRDYYALVKGADLDPYNGMMIFPCSSETPDFVVSLGDYRAVVPGSYINYGQRNETHCYGGIQSSDGIGFAIVGDVFLKSQFVVFDIGNGSIGFANKKTASSY